MRKAVASFGFLVAVMAMPALAGAQVVRVWVGPYAPLPPVPAPIVVPVPPIYVPPVYAPPVYATPAVAYNPVPAVPIQPVQLDRRWGIGLRYLVTTMNQTVAGEDMVMSGGSLFTRYRHSRHWGFELAFDGSAGKFGGERFKRSSFTPSASVMLHLTPRGIFDLHLLGGVGWVVSSVEVQNPPGHPDLAVGKQHLGEFQAHIGAGAELRLGRMFGIVADARYMGRVLDTSSQDGRWYKGVDQGVVPTTSQGFQFTAGLMLHF